MWSRCSRSCVYGGNQIIISLGNGLIIIFNFYIFCIEYSYQAVNTRYQPHSLIYLENLNDRVLKRPFQDQKLKSF